MSHSWSMKPSDLNSAKNATSIRPVTSSSHVNTSTKRKRVNQATHSLTHTLTHTLTRLRFVLVCRSFQQIESYTALPQWDSPEIRSAPPELHPSAFATSPISDAVLFRQHDRQDRRTLRSSVFSQTLPVRCRFSSYPSFINRQSRDPPRVASLAPCVSTSVCRLLCRSMHHERDYV
ncbi:hypothetical protein Pla52n_29360 [Stieleria varia]|uniref:Uncharacterized protein n=1 Tax=Stieleria varia TaxID=2528005 RepID=A0A5C6B001_9BACT|nr:hypothetical protein Pla52n_29360 [Stieleria varia]